MGAKSYPDRACIRAGCDQRFTPSHRDHLFCAQGCWTAVLHDEIGATAAGMRPLGLMGDRKKIHGVMRKYKRLALGSAERQRAEDGPVRDTPINPTKGGERHE